MQTIKTGIAELLQQTPKSDVDKDAYIAELQSTVQALADDIKNLDQMLALLRKKQFGSSSEKTSTKDDAQLGMFNESEKEFTQDAPEPIKKDKRGWHRRNALEQWKLLKANEITFNEILLDLQKEQRICQQCGNEMACIGKEVVREVPEFIPAKLIIKRYVQPSYCCPCCKKNGVVRIIKRPAPKPLLNHSMASASVVAEVMYQKYVQAVPLARQEKTWENMGVAFSRTTMANWVIRCSQDWLAPVWEYMHKMLVQREVLHADETVVQVLKEAGKAPTSKSYMWLYRTGKCDNTPIVLYDYQSGRSGEHAKAFLTGFKGYLHTDGYAGYNKVPDITRCGCWAHVRRKFYDAMPKSGYSLANMGFEYCNQLFAVERKIEELSPQERQKQRLELAHPIQDAFWCWLDKLALEPLGGGLKTAVEYALNQRTHLKNYLEDPRLSVSNNLAENAIRPFTVGRKNWLFSDTPKGAQASAVIYSLVETAKANHVEPKCYLEFLLDTLPNLDFARHPEKLALVMPWNESVFQYAETE